MAECHRCRHRADVEAGRYAHVEFAQTPCAKCELKAGDSFAIDFSDELPRGRTAEPGEESLDCGQGRPESVVEDVHFAEEVGGEEERQLPVSVLWDLVVMLLTLPPRTRDVVCWRYAGYKYRDIARVQHVTVTAVELRHRKALRRYPLLRCLFPSKAGRQRCRKRHAVAGVEERT